MGNDVLSLRQLMVLLTVALLAPAADLLPGGAARLAGGAGWLAPLGALPILLAAVWLCGSLCREGRGLAGAFRGELGTILGGTLTIIYMVWVIVLLSHGMHMSSARMAVIYGDGPAAVCAAALLALAVWMALAKAAAFARAGEIFYLALAVALAAILLLAAVKVESKNLMPENVELKGLVSASGFSAGVLLRALPGAFLLSKVKPQSKSGRRAAGWTIVICVASALLAAAVIGSAGPRLTARLPAPFLTMVQGLGIKGTFQRTEALAAALWTLSDLAFFGMLLQAWKELAVSLRPGKWAKWSVLPAAILALAAAWLLFEGSGPADVKVEVFLSGTGLLFGLAVPAGVRLIKAIRDRR